MGTQSTWEKQKRKSLKNSNPKLCATKFQSLLSPSSTKLMVRKDFCKMMTSRHWKTNLVNSQELRTLTGIATAKLVCLVTLAAELITTKASNRVTMESLQQI